MTISYVLDKGKCDIFNFSILCHFAKHTCINIKMPISLFIYKIDYHRGYSFS